MFYLDAIALVRAHFGRGRGPIFLDDVRCNGSEIRIVDCPNKPNEHNCNHKEDAGVICTRKLDVRKKGAYECCIITNRCILKV